MLLYFAPGTCALAPHIALEWSGANYAIEKVDLRSEAYRQVNPLGMVPALRIANGRLLTQADAILKFIATSFPDAGLGAGDGELAEFNLDEALAFLTGDVHPAFWPYFGPGRFTTKTDDDSLKAVRESAYPRIERVMNHLEHMLEEGHVVNGKRTIADPYAFAMIRWTANLPKTWKEYPVIADFMGRLLKDPGVQAALSAQGLT
ncbi:glutathione S-transferase N-terminal domain-containing protein [Synechococcus sp. RedBA-s]|uniref:glutathione S-transferase N-terminal domain-containing protein n=1 Tax=Synechococcus sp. RedBA-s TaxID=2823741 RepID=UPI0020CD7C7F|nr:glutathione S-transferase N-terminal domain-containing protein [Synechococcus sp. RedBA-s]MCP9801812.1 glutathione S-transferase N-terminal domain-containing protein [Synechococcus sp. RedBA-s]